MSEETREIKNQIFAGLSETEKQVLLSKNVIPGGMPPSVEFGIEAPPVETVPLLSKGLVYSKDHALYLRQSVDIRPMKISELDMLSNKAVLKKGGRYMIRELVKACMVDKTINVSTMLQSDVFAVLMGIRIVSFGANYATEFVCPSCEAKDADHEFDLSKLELKVLETAPVVEGTNIFSFTLPGAKKEILFKLLTEEDAEEIEQNEDAAKKKGIQLSNAVSSQLLHQIISVGGKDDRGYIAKFIREGLTVRDLMAMRKYIVSVEPTIVMKQTVACSSCDFTEDMAVPINESFLFPV
jgi:hypothetical protein